VINASGGTQSIVIRGVGPTTGVTIAKGESATVAWNGSDFVKVGSSGGAITFTDLTVTGNTILGDAAADTLTVNATSTFASPVNFQGQVKLPSTGRSAAAALTPTNPAFLYGVASTYTDTTSSGTLASVASFYGFAQPTLSTSNVTTYTTAATLYIANAPATAGSATITNPYALYVAAGNTYLGDSMVLGSSSADTATVNATITSNLLFTDNTYDIGAAAATRPRSIFLSSSATVDSQVAFGRPGVVRGYAGFYPSTGFAWWYIRNDNAGGLEFSTGASVGTDVALTLGPLGSTSTLKSNLIFSPDNTYDIGASGATRPRTVWAGSAVVTPYVSTTNGQRIYRGGNSGSGGYRWWKIGTWVPNADSNMAEITMYGAVGYSAGQPIEGKTTILLRRNNASVSVGTWSYTGAVGSTGPTGAVINSSTGDVYLLLGNFFQLQATAIYCDSDGWTTSYVDTGSGTQPVSTTALVNQQMFGNSGTISVDYANGYVSIGTTSFNTARKLYVYGGDLLVEKPSGNVGIGVYSQGGSGRAYYMTSDTQGFWQLYDDSAAANRITVTSGGLVGISATPNTWQGSISVLQLGGQATWSYGGGTNSVFGVNRYFNSGEKFISASGYATYHEQSGGYHNFGISSAASGGAGSAITWTYPLSLQPGGGVLMPGGSTSIPGVQAGYVLDVRGNVIAQKASGNVSFVASASNANAAMNAYEGFGVEFNTDSSYTSYAWAAGGARKMYLIANDSGTYSLGLGNVSNPQAYTANGSRCAIVTQQPIVSNDTVFSRIQSRGYIVQDTGGSTQWVKFGTYNTSQGGYMCRLRVTGHVGFNASPGQLGMVEIQFSTSNNSASQAGSTGNFYGSVLGYRTGPGNVVITIRVVQVTTDTYQIWGYIPNYSNGSYYEVSFSDGTSWTHDGTVGTPSGNYIDVTPYTITYT
jgi:hypothetical protein